MAKQKGSSTKWFRDGCYFGRKSGRNFGRNILQNTASFGQPMASEAKNQ
jgi:hypothetical protein